MTFDIYEFIAPICCHDSAVSIIVEPTSGNQGIGLALVGAVRGYRTIIVMPDSVSIERRKLVQHYGAEVVLVHDDGDIGKCIHECLATAMRMKEQDKRVFVPQQFINKNNIVAQKTTTAREILEQVNGPIHGFCSGIGTGGTITGIGEVLREHNPDIEIWAAEPEDAAILAGGSIGTHVQMGIGDGLIPDILNTEVYDNTCIIPDDNALDMAKRLASEEHVRNIIRHKRGRGNHAGRKARPGQNSSNSTPGYSRALLLHPTVRRITKNIKSGCKSLAAEYGSRLAAA